MVELYYSIEKEADKRCALQTYYCNEPWLKACFRLLRYDDRHH
jgi:hypothetical protein